MHPSIAIKNEPVAETAALLSGSGRRRSLKPAQVSSVPISRSATIAMTGGLVAQGLKFLVILYVARHFPVSEFGLLSFAIAINAYMYVISNFGLNLFGSRAVAQSGVVSGALLAEVCCLEAVLAVVGLGLALSALSFMAGISGLELRLIALFGLSNLIQAGLFDWVFQGLHRQEVSAALNILWQGTWFALTVAGIRLGMGIIAVPAALCASALLAAAVGFMWIRRIPWAEPSVGEHAPLLQRSWLTLRSAAPLGWGTLLITVLIWADIIVVRLLQGDYAAAIYAAGERPALALGLLLNFYLQGTFPGLCQASQGGAEPFGRSLQRVYADAALLFMPGSIWSAFYGRDILRLLFQRSEYEAATLIFRVFQLMLPLVVFTYILGNNVLLPLRQDRAYQTVLLTAVALFVVACPLFTHWWGSLGAALAKVAGYLLASLLFFLASRRWVVLHHRQALLPPCVTGLAAGILSRLLHFSLLPGALVLLAGSAVLWTLRTWTAKCPGIGPEETGASA